MKSAKFKSFTVIAGILTALAIILSQLFYYQATDFRKKEVKTEKQEKKTSSAEKTAFIPSLSSSVLTSVHVDLNHKSFLLFEILFSEKEQETYHPEIPITLGKYFHTLFHIIISPNAP